MLSLFKNSKTHSKGKLCKHFKKIAPQESISKVYERFTNADNKKNQRKHLLKTIDMCYNNLANQIELTQMLHLPFVPGPISLHAFPTVLLEQNQVIGHRGQAEQEGEQTQLQFLFNFLKNVRQYYYCWVIYFNEDLKVLNVKLLKKEQVEEYEDLFNPVLNLIGIFINRTRETNLKPNRRLSPNHKFIQEYYGSEIHRKAVDFNNHNKSISTVNSSTGTTWKTVAKKIEKINEASQQMEASSYFKSEMKQKKLMKELKKHSLSKCNQQSNSIKKQNKSSSIKQLKQKSKSHILLNRSKSNNFKQIILEPIKHEQQQLGQKFKTCHLKSKLKKESKTNKIASIYFKKLPIVD